MGKKYMDTKTGTLEESILGVWQDAVDDLDEKYTDAQRRAREKHRSGERHHGGTSQYAPGRSGKPSETGGDDMGGVGTSAGQKKHQDRRGASHKRAGGGGDYAASNMKGRKYKGSGQYPSPYETGKDKDRQAKLKMDLLKKKQQRERDRQRLAASYDPTELDLEILVLEQMIEEIELNELTADQKKAREKSRGHSGRMGYGMHDRGGRETKRDRESVRVYARDRNAHALKTRSGQRSERDRQARLKMDLLKKKQQRERDRARDIAASYDPTELDLEILVLEQMIEEIEFIEFDELNEYSRDTRDGLAKRRAREKARGKGGRKYKHAPSRTTGHDGGDGQAPGGKEKQGDRHRAYRHAHGDDPWRRSKADRRKQDIKNKDDRESRAYFGDKEAQKKLKMRLLKKKQQRERDRARELAASYDPTELDLEILVLEQMIEGLENSPNPANSWHLCAKNVVHEEWGSGQTIPTMHAEPDEDGDIAWYDVMFEHGIEEGVLISELKVTKSEGHMHASYNGKKKKNEAMDKVDKKALKKDFDDRKDKDIDNDGDEDESDKYLHKKRQAISKSMKERWAEAVRKVQENENGNGEDPSDEDDEDEKKNGKNGKKAKVEINPKMDVDEKKK